MPWDLTILGSCSLVLPPLTWPHGPRCDLQVNRKYLNRCCGSKTSVPMLIVGRPKNNTYSVASDGKPVYLLKESSLLDVPGFGYMLV